METSTSNGNEQTTATNNDVDDKIEITIHESVTNMIRMNIDIFSGLKWVDQVIVLGTWLI